MKQEHEAVLTVKITSKAAAWTFIRSLSFGVHEVQCTESEKDLLRDVAWGYSERVAGGVNLDARLHVVRVVTSLEQGCATITVKDHEWIEQDAVAFGARAVIEHAVDELEQSQVYVVECTAGQVAAIRVAASRRGGLKVRRTEGGCSIVRAGGNDTLVQSARDAVARVKAGETVTLRYGLQTSTIRTLLYQVADTERIRISTSYNEKRGTLLVSDRDDKAHKEVAALIFKKVGRSEKDVRRLFDRVLMELHDE